MEPKSDKKNEIINEEKKNLEKEKDKIKKIN